MFARQHQAGEQIPRAGALWIDEPGKRTARDVVHIIDGATEDAGLAPFGNTGRDRRMRRRGIAGDPRADMSDRLAADHVIAKLRKQQHAARMLAALPQAQGHAPFLQARTEIFGAVDRIEHRDPAIMRDRFRAIDEAFLANQPEPRQALAKPGIEAVFEKYIGFGYRAAVGFPPDIETPLIHFRQGLRNEPPDTVEQLRDLGCHSTRDRYLRHERASVSTSPCRLRSNGRMTLLNPLGVTTGRQKSTFIIPLL